MTLASHLRCGALGEWFRAGSLDHAALADRVGDALRGRVPLRSARRSTAGHRALVQAIVRARLGLVVQHAPPYRALVGAHRLGLAPRRELHELAARFPSHTGLSEGRRRTALRWRPAGPGWLDVGDPLSPGRPVPRGRDGRVARVVATELELLDAWAPPGRLADPATERQLAAMCAVTAGWAAGVPAAPRHGPPAGDKAGPFLPAAAQDEAAELVALACEAGILTRLHRCAGRPGAGLALGTADAVFVPRWAEGGTVIGPGTGGSGPALLVDVVTPADPLRDLGRLHGWCHHLLARAWLDAPDRHGVTHVGLYFARHGALATWPLDELAAATARDDRAARNPFLELARRAATADGVVLRAPRASSTADDRGARRASSLGSDNILCMT
ncbi:hypothetical protein LQ327_30140 [Actinomycetospora endophytica]|uniref:Winged helix DNA-binding protein n=1 Tax=Actinomycetospora endophytica TaxID=2291215 RepID=A0ABS8PH89_9PSEU|nr:hypothetical protein [Actinomycetospora endophytica]MCD2197640.1 hypothetical protein [Actinomycetospora endophytica]